MLIPTIGQQVLIDPIPRGGPIQATHVSVASVLTIFTSLFFCS